MYKETGHCTKKQDTEKAQPLCKDNIQFNCPMFQGYTTPERREIGVPLEY